MRSAVVAIVLAGCFQSNYDFAEGTIRCDGTACPPGYACSDGYCFRTPPGSHVDAPIEVLIDAPPSGGADAATACSAGQMRCDHGTPQSCSDGNWVSQTPCGGDKPQCLNGSCIAGCTANTYSCSG